MLILALPEAQDETVNFVNSSVEYSCLYKKYKNRRRTARVMIEKKHSACSLCIPVSNFTAFSACYRPIRCVDFHGLDLPLFNPAGSRHVASIS